jgi:hypothetical protein
MGKDVSRTRDVRKKEHPDGFLSLKDFHRAVNAEMETIKKMKAID